MALQTRGNNGRLPLHLAADNPAPLDVIRLLAEMHPEALTVKDHDGREPIHVADLSTRTNVEAVRVLANLCPAALHVKDNDGDLPLHSAV